MKVSPVELGIACDDMPTEGQIYLVRLINPPLVGQEVDIAIPVYRGKHILWFTQWGHELTGMVVSWQQIILHPLQ